MDVSAFNQYSALGHYTDLFFKFTQAPTANYNVQFVPVRRRRIKASSRRSTGGIVWKEAPFLVSTRVTSTCIELSERAFLDARKHGVPMNDTRTQAASHAPIQFLTPSDLSPQRPTSSAWAQPRSWAQHAASPVQHKGKSALKLHSPGIVIHTPSPESTQSRPSTPTRQHKPSIWNSTRSSPNIEQLYEKAHEINQAPMTIPVGLVNQGNSCFASVILQMLVYCRPLYSFLTQLNAMVPQDLTNSTPLLEAIFQFYSEIPVLTNQNSLLNDDMDPIAPDYVYDALRLHRRFDLFQLGHQEDAEEFFSLILNTLHEEVDLVYRRTMKKKQSTPKHSTTLEAVASKDPYAAHPPPTNNDDSSDDEIDAREVQRPQSPDQNEWLEVGQKGKTSLTRTSGNTDSESPITRMFDGKLRSTLACPGTKTSIMLEPYRSLPLDIQPPHIHTIEDALRQITEPEIISGVWSPQRNTPVDATKQVCIEALPPVLVLHLKRFVFDGTYGVQKSTKPIRFGMTLDLPQDILSQPCRRVSDFNKYALFGVVYHHGRLATGGHYTVAVRRQDDSGWIHFDDTRVSSIPAEQVVSSAHGNKLDAGQAYLLFYQRLEQ